MNFTPSNVNISNRQAAALSLKGGRTACFSRQAAVCLLFGLQAFTAGADAVELPADYCTGEVPRHIGIEAGTGAGEVWKEFGVYGQGVKIGISSMGVAADHESLKDNYAGTLPDGSFDHNYAWLEPLEKNPAPFDDRFVVGTFVTGVIAGIDPVRCFGVAPRAKYMACKPYDSLGRDTPEDHKQCLGWFLEPHDLNKENPRPELRPDVVYTQPCPSCLEGDDLLPLTEQLRAAGTVVVTDAGFNEPTQSGCAKIVVAPTNYPNVITVSALNTNNEVLSTSALGPGNLLSNLLQKPNLATVGENVESASIGGTDAYTLGSGSIVAAGIATGAVALVLSANPELKGQPRLVEDILYSTARPRPFADCNEGNGISVPEVVVPNWDFGYGELNVYEAVKRAMEYPYGGCPAQPVAQCHMDGNYAAFSVSQNLLETEDAAQRMEFRYADSGTALTNLFGAPDLDESQAVRLCVYDTVDDVAVPTGAVLNSGFELPTANGVAAGGWSRAGTSGAIEYRFDGPSVEGNDGIVMARLDEGAASIQITGTGTALPLSRVRSRHLISQMYEATDGIIVQAHSTASGVCWGANFSGSDITVNANDAFAAEVSRYTITTSVTPNQGGSVICDPNPVKHGESSSCAATANIGYQFTTWSGDCTDTTCNLTGVDGARSVVAQFERDPAFAYTCTPAPGPATVLPPDHQGNMLVESETDIVTDGVVIVPGGVTVSYMASDSITLTEHFHAEDGSSFQAIITDVSCQTVNGKNM